MRSSCLAALVSILLLTACARETIVLLPDEQGKVGVLAVQSEDDTVVLDQPLAGTTQGGLGLRATEFSSAEVQRDFADALAAQPVQPQRFTLYFFAGGIRLKPESAAELERLLGEVAQRKVVDVQVTGHTDSVGDRNSNDRLSLQRAEQIRDELMRLGLQATVVRVAGRGERELLVATADEVAHPLNRRVEVIVR